jgi:hypothetical protein
MFVTLRLVFAALTMTMFATAAAGVATGEVPPTVTITGYEPLIAKVEPQNVVLDPVTSVAEQARVVFEVKSNTQGFFRVQDASGSVVYEEPVFGGNGDENRSVFWDGRDQPNGNLRPWHGPWAPPGTYLATLEQRDPVYRDHVVTAQWNIEVERPPVAVAPTPPPKPARSNPRLINDAMVSVPGTPIRCAASLSAGRPSAVCIDTRPGAYDAEITMGMVTIFTFEPSGEERIVARYKNRPSASGVHATGPAVKGWSGGQIGRVAGTVISCVPFQMVRGVLCSRDSSTPTFSFAMTADEIEVTSYRSTDDVTGKVAGRFRQVASSSSPRYPSASELLPDAGGLEENAPNEAKELGVATSTFGRLSGAIVTYQDADQWQYVSSRAIVFSSVAGAREAFQAITSRLGAGRVVRVGTDGRGYGNYGRGEIDVWWVYKNVVAWVRVIRQQTPYREGTCTLSGNICILHPTSSGRRSPPPGAGTSIATNKFATLTPLGAAREQQELIAAALDQ